MNPQAALEARADHLLLLAGGHPVGELATAYRAGVSDVRRAALAEATQRTAAGEGMARHLLDALNDSEELMSGAVVLTAEHAKQLNADIDAWEASEPLSPEDAWDELVNVDDRTSPEEYPDMCLITRDELFDFMRRATPPASEATPAKAADYNGHIPNKYLPALPAGASLFAVNPKAGNWYYVNHAGTWQGMPSPLPKPTSPEGGLPVAGDVVEMLQSVEMQEGCAVFDHSAEEIGIAVMENHAAVLAALTASPSPSERVDVATSAAYRAIYGSEMDPFQHPESWEYAGTVADAVIRALNPAVEAAPGEEG
ncbi:MULTISPECIES: hypothetical protein [unclassified Sphingomonas]|uniref:hypothetical protein n=1 Tax=unclassified Sphingomonas TaxID=196159 RepID=UPI002269811A|nr:MULTISPECIES: hypothetical protein [unclassified Sphingomonas]